MQLKLFMTLWGFDGDYVGAVEAAAAAGFDGIEGPAPEDADERRRFRRALATHGLDYIAEICTAGGYVPDRHASPSEHLASLGQRLARSRRTRPALRHLPGRLRRLDGSAEHRLPRLGNGPCR